MTKPVGNRLTFTAVDHILRIDSVDVDRHTTMSIASDWINSLDNMYPAQLVTKAPVFSTNTDTHQTVTARFGFPQPHRAIARPVLDISVK